MGGWVSGWLGGWLVGWVGTRMNCGKTAEAIEMPFGVETRMDKRHIVSAGMVLIPSRGGG